MKAFEIGNYYDDFIVGDLITHSTSKTIFESDNNLFSLMTMNHHPLHTNLDFSKKQDYEKILVVGTLVFSIAVGLSVPDISGKAIANLAYESVDHLKPVFLNDTIYAKTKILDKWETTKNKNRGIIYVETIAYNQNSESVLSFRRKVLIPKMP
ncbi:MAG: dehydratase [Flammeovirgaceae bacterium]|nr:dehydratase [Flammeovirgaceae bacterium]|tara:strand:+ start:99 stop:557 length:459 start_codon:yes stop_codon:yes gene_type:complete